MHKLFTVILILAISTVIFANDKSEKPVYCEKFYTLSSNTGHKYEAMAGICEYAIPEKSLWCVVTIAGSSGGISCVPMKQQKTEPKDSKIVK